MYPADVFFLLGDVTLLGLPGLHLLLVPFLPQPPVCLVVAGVRGYPAFVHLKYLGHDLVEKVAVVG